MKLYEFYQFGLMIFGYLASRVLTILLHVFSLFSSIRLNLASWVLTISLILNRFNIRQELMIAFCLTVLLVMSVKGKIYLSWPPCSQQQVSSRRDSNIHLLYCLKQVRRLTQRVEEKSSKIYINQGRVIQWNKIICTIQYLDICKSDTVPFRYKRLRMVQCIQIIFRYE